MDGGSSKQLWNQECRWSAVCWRCQAGPVVVSFPSGCTRGYPRSVSSQGAVASSDRAVGQGGYGGIGTAEHQLPKLAVARTEQTSVGKEVVVPEMTEAFGI